MKKSYKFDVTLGIVKAECASVKKADWDEHNKLQEMDLPKGTPSLVYEPIPIIFDFSVNPLVQMTEEEIPLFSEENVVKVTEVVLITGESIYFLIPFNEFEKFFVDYKRIKFE